MTVCGMLRSLWWIFKLRFGQELNNSKTVPPDANGFNVDSQNKENHPLEWLMESSPKEFSPKESSPKEFSSKGNPRPRNFRPRNPRPMGIFVQGNFAQSDFLSREWKFMILMRKKLNIIQ